MDAHFQLRILALASLNHNKRDLGGLPYVYQQLEHYFPDIPRDQWSALVTAHKSEISSLRKHAKSLDDSQEQAAWMLQAHQGYSWIAKLQYDKPKVPLEDQPLSPGTFNSNLAVTGANTRKRRREADKKIKFNAGPIARMETRAVKRPSVSPTPSEHSEEDVPTTQQRQLLANLEAIPMSEPPIAPEELEAVKIARAKQFAALYAVEEDDESQQTPRKPHIPTPVTTQAKTPARPVQRERKSSFTPLATGQAARAQLEAALSPAKTPKNIPAAASGSAAKSASVAPPASQLREVSQIKPTFPSRSASRASQKLVPPKTDAEMLAFKKKIYKQIRKPFGLNQVQAMELWWSCSGDIAVATGYLSFLANSQPPEGADIIEHYEHGRRIWNFEDDRDLEDYLDEEDEMFIDLIRRRGEVNVRRRSEFLRDWEEYKEVYHKPRYPWTEL